jgi:methylmalonyl-CoA/ethylmalonyl-CoA epimerase
MMKGIAHTAICVADVEAATSWYESVLGLRVLAPPYRMEGEAIERDMGELVPSPVVVKASIVGFDDSDHVLELIEYPGADTERRERGPITQPGLSHIGLLCDDIDATRRHLESHGVEMLTTGVASIVGLRTTWFRDPWGVVFILLEKRRPERPYWRQHAPG